MITTGSQNRPFRIQFLNKAAVVHERLEVLEPGVEVPNFQHGELIQYTDDNGRFRGYVDRVRHEITIGSGNISFVTTLVCYDSQQV